MAKALQSAATFDIGEDTGTPVCTTYNVPFKFTRKIESVTTDLKPQPHDVGRGAAPA